MRPKCPAHLDANALVAATLKTIADTNIAVRLACKVWRMLRVFWRERCNQAIIHQHLTVQPLTLLTTSRILRECPGFTWLTTWWRRLRCAYWPRRSNWRRRARTTTWKRNAKFWRSSDDACNKSSLLHQDDSFWHLWSWFNSMNLCIVLEPLELSSFDFSLLAFFCTRQAHIHVIFFSVPI